MKTIEIKLPEGLWMWLMEQKNWLGVVIAALAEYRQRHPVRKK